MLTLSPRNLFGLLTALGKRLYSDDNGEEDQLTDAVLMEELGCGEAEIHSIEALLKKAAVNNWGDDSLTAFLMDGGSDFTFNADQKTVVSKFWADNRERIAKVLQTRSTFNNRYENMNWRVDMKVASRKYSDINEPTAFFELSTSGSGREHPNPHIFQKLDGDRGLTNSANSKATAHKIYFEMNQHELKETIATLATVHQAIEKFG